LVTEGYKLQLFENVIILGAGALGVYAAALASHYGCRRIVVTDKINHRLEFVRDFGAWFNYIIEISRRLCGISLDIQSNPTTDLWR